MTELDIYQTVTDRLGRVPADKDEARAVLHKMIKETPNWICCLPESLLGKLGINYDYQFDDKEISLAAVIGGKLARRLL